MPSTYAMAALTTNAAEEVEWSQTPGAVMAKGKGQNDDDKNKGSGGQSGGGGASGGGGDNLGKDTKEGRKGKQQRLRELGNDPKQPSEVRGWIKNEIKHIEDGKRTTIRVPKNKELAHCRGYEARTGSDYSNSDLQDPDIHRIQHKFEGYRQRPSWVRVLIDKILGRE